MVAPVIALGVYELLAAGAAATGLGAFAVAKRREIAEGLSDATDAAQDAFRETAIQAIPYIIGAATGHAIWRPRALPDVTAAGPVETLPLPGFADAGAWGSIGVPRFPAVPVADGDAAPLPVVRELPRVTDIPPPPAGGPEDPFKGLRRATDKVRDAAGQARDLVLRVAQNRWVQGVYTLYKWQTYGLAVLATAEISRRAISGNKDHGPILYDYAYAPLFGESVAARTILGGQQLMAEETTAGILAVTLAKAVAPKWLTGLLDVSKFTSQLPTFLSINAYAALGNWSFIEHQMAANNVAAQDVDFNRATRTAGLFGFTSIAYFPAKDWLINLPMFGRVGFREWWMRWGAAKVPTLQRTLTSTEGLNWMGAQVYRGAEFLFGRRVASWLAPHYVPKLQTIGVYAVFATAYRNIAQAIASLPFFEDSDMGESLAMTNVRSAASTLLFDPYFYLGAKSNSVRSILGNQVIFMGLVYYLDQFYSPFDGTNLAVAEADRTLKAAFATGGEALAQATLSKPLTQRNFSVPPETDLSVKTWAELTRQYANHEVLNPTMVAALVTTMRSHLKSSEPGQRRAGMALGVMLSQVALTSRSVSEAWSGWRVGLAAILEKDGVQIHPRHAGRPLNADELDRVFEDINAGLYDESPLFQFPRS